LNILLVEDDVSIGAFIANALRTADQSIDVAIDGALGLSLTETHNYDLVVVDRMLPNVDGIALVRELRHRGEQVPILMLSALGEVDARVEGLSAGADDYLAKPFALVELKARIAALARRASLRNAFSHLQVADLELDRVRREARRAGRRIELQPREFRLLEYLMTHAGKTVTRSMLLEQVWEFYFDPQTSLVETHISRLRTKIDRDFESSLLHTVRGVGYCLRGPD
jgi:two-component system OmpR family response regulator